MSQATTVYRTNTALCLKYFTLCLKYITESIAILTRLLSSAGLTLFGLKAFIEQRENHPNRSLSISISMFALFFNIYINAISRGLSIHHWFHPLPQTGKKEIKSEKRLSYRSMAIYFFLIANNLISVMFSCLAGHLSGNTLYTDFQDNFNIDKHSPDKIILVNLLGAACIIGNVFSFFAFNFPKMLNTALKISRLTLKVILENIKNLIILSGTVLSLFYVITNAIFCSFTIEKEYENLGAHPKERDTALNEFLYDTLFISAITSMVNVLTSMVPTVIEALNRYWYKKPTEQNLLAEKVWDNLHKQSPLKRSLFWLTVVFGIFDSVSNTIGNYAALSNKVEPYNEKLFDGIVGFCLLSSFLNYFTFNVLYGFEKMSLIHCERNYPELYARLKEEAKNEIKTKGDVSVNASNGVEVIYSRMREDRHNNTSPRTFSQKCCPSFFNRDDQKRPLLEETNGRAPESAPTV